MLTYLEGARYKVQSALAELENRQRTSHPLAAHITITRDKSGLQQSILKVPNNITSYTSKYIISFYYNDYLFTRKPAAKAKNVFKV